MKIIMARIIHLVTLVVVVLILIAGWYGYQLAGIRLLLDNFSLCS